MTLKEKIEELESTKRFQTPYGKQLLKWLEELQRTREINNFERAIHKTYTKDSVK